MQPSAAERKEINAAALQDRFASILGMGSVGKKSATKVTSDVHIRQVRGNESKYAATRRLRDEKITLAQCIGIEKRPDPLLSQKEWHKVVHKSRERNSCSEPCAICLQVFKDEDIVLLSCSHVFHKKCLRSFEHLSRQRTCPICRSTNYQKKKIDDGKIKWKEECAIRIQSWYRGHLARKKFKHLQKTIPPQDPEKRQTFYREKLGSLSDDLLYEMEQDKGDIDSLFRELDTSLQQSRALPDVKATNKVSPASNDKCCTSTASSSSSSPSSSSSSSNGIAWHNIIGTANNIAIKDCPICISSLYRPDTEDHCVALLTCGHVFHMVRCIDSWTFFFSQSPNKLLLSLSLYHF